jgi:biotin carboxyl carrier protein
LNAQLSPPAGPSATENTFGEWQRFLEGMARLFDSSTSPEEFHRGFLEGVLRVMQAAGGAIWALSPQQDCQLQFQINLNELRLDDVPGGRAGHDLLLRQACQRDRASWVPPQSGALEKSGIMASANPTRHALLFAPILTERLVIGIIEIWLGMPPDQAQRRHLARLLMEMATFEAAFLHKSQWKGLLERQNLLSQMESFTRQLHGSLDAREVAYFLANDCRSLLGCDRVSVVWRRGKSGKLEAVSGSPGVDKQSRLVQTMQTLGGEVLAWGERLTFEGARSEVWPPAVQKALDAYLTESNSRWLLVIPLNDPRDKAQERPCSWGLCVESFGPAVELEPCARALELVVPHATSALYNAGQFRRLPLRSLVMGLARVRDGLGARKLLKVGLFVSVAAIVIGLFAFLQVPHRYDARGQLLPQHRQTVFSPLGGKIVEVKVQPGDVVEKGQELLFVEDLETQLQIDQLNVKTAASEQRLIFLTEQIGKTNSQEERISLTKERLTQDYELRKAMAERDILLAASRSPRKAPLPSPLGGKVLTFDAQEQLLGKTVKAGDPLLRVAMVKGPWEIELHIPEANIHAIRESLDKASDGELDIDLLLVSQPHRTFKGKLHRDGLGGETIVKDNKVVLPARARVADPDLTGQLEKLAVGVEVRAKIHCGRRSLGYVWFSETWEFIYETFLF